MNIENIWNKFLNTIKTRLSSLSYNTWFSSSKLVEINEDALVIIVPTIAHKKHLSESYMDIIEEIFNSITGTNFNIEFLLESEYEKIKKEDITIKEEENIEVGVPHNSIEKANLNPDYTFENVYNYILSLFYNKFYCFLLFIIV